MTNGTQQVTRQDIETLHSRIHEIERRHADEMRQMSDRLVKTEIHQKSGLRRLDTLERDAKRLWLIGWGVAFAVGGTLLEFVGKLF